MRGRALLAGVDLAGLTLREHVDLATVLLLEGCTLAERTAVEEWLDGLDRPGTPEVAPVSAPTRSRWAVSEDEWGLDVDSQADRARELAEAP